MFLSHLINPVLHGEGRRPQIKLEDKDIGNVGWKQIPFRMAFSVHDNIYLHFTFYKIKSGSLDPCGLNELILVKADPLSYPSKVF